jgi:aspartyl-tRNA(Asn)/glutamyl-tRNA(Gln) amidotransferase subunit A
MSFFDKPISEVVKDVVSGKTTALSLVEKSLKVISEKNSDINAFVLVTPESAKKRAAEIDALSADEKSKMVLCGIPIGIKDNICIDGVKTTCASKILGDFTPPYNADVIEKLNLSGAIVVGKTNMDEFAMGSSNENSAFGNVKNPVNTDYVPGGSSGGSAAAVAADMVPLTLGSDTGGSIRQPASHCGVVGMKPTYGMVSRYGLVAFASSLDQIGPFASSVKDASLLLSVIAGEDKRDSTNGGKSFGFDETMSEKSLAGVKIGLPTEYFGEGLTDGVRAKIEESKAKLIKAGAELVDVSLPNVSHGIATYYVLATAEASTNLSRFDGVKFGHRAEGATSLDDMYKKTRGEGFGDEVKRRIMLGTYVLSSGYYDAYYIKAAKVRTLISQDFEKAFESCDCILSPVTPAPAFKIGEKVEDPIQMYLTDIYTVSANLAGVPGVSVPAGLVDGLPVGAQLMAPKWGDEKLMRVASHL